MPADDKSGKPTTPSPPIEPPGPPALLRFSTDWLAPKDRFEAFREEFALKYMKLDITSAERDGFSAEMETCRAGPVVISTGHSSPLKGQRTPRLASLSEDGVAVLISLRGRHHCDQAGIETDLAIGDTMVFDVEQPGFAQHDAGSGREQSNVSLRILREDMARVLPGPVPRYPCVLRSTDPVVRLMRRYIERNLPSLPALAPDASERMGVHIIDLLSAAMGGSREVAELAGLRGVKAARIEAILAEIATSAHRPDIDAGLVAARLAITPRYVNKLLEATGRTFSEHVLERRLQLALSRLKDPLLATEKIIAIAYTCGFVDLSSFNRAFKRRFGDTPSAFRPREQ